MEHSPAKTAACFAEYMPKLNTLTVEFEQDLNLCESIAEDRLGYFEVEVNGTRVYLTNVASETCKAYTNCNKKAAAVDFFTCYAEVRRYKIFFLHRAREQQESRLHLQHH